ncbi:sn-glycerol-3-phosphate ABC transporter permease [Chromatiales bacterium (ex Bugula neritina AB1)]|nr:sn-glycerol-3-phosphate ABC transporter permease [Chromatiales bacterium (ex Bugula neritina AB1)]
MVTGYSLLRRCTSHVVLLCGLIFILAPVVLMLFSSTHTTQVLQQQGLQWFPGEHAVSNYSRVFGFEAGYFDQVTPGAMLINSLIVAVGVATLTTFFSLLTAYAIVFFRMPVAAGVFWLVLATLLFPLESRFITTFQVTASLGLINTHMGIILPVLAAALGTFFFRQYFLTLPKHLIEAAILDGAGPLKFFVDIIMPISLPRAGAIFVIAFMIGWNQYLWPLMISTDDSMYTLVRGIRLIGQESGPGMALLVITIIPPFILLLAFQRWFYQALTHVE